MDDCKDVTVNASRHGHDAPPLSKGSRKVAKPIMEKKRRARINASLNELKSLLVEVLQKEGCRHSSKMEKADILEMTVKHLRQLQKQQLPGHQAADLTSFDKFSSGYNECLSRVSDYLRVSTATSGQESTLAIKLLDHLSGRTQEIGDRVNAASAKLGSSPDVTSSTPTTTGRLPSPSASRVPVVAKTASNELTLVLPQTFMNATGYLIPAVYTSTANKMAPSKQEPGQGLTMISFNCLNNAAQQQPSMAASRPPPTSSPMWRPW